MPNVRIWHKTFVKFQTNKPSPIRTALNSLGILILRIVGDACQTEYGVESLMMI
jgi:hypothetical protein